MGRSRLLALPRKAVFTLLLLGCGPSFQAIYEGNARFEHCYALEENPQTPMPEKATCWRDWSERYTYGQTRDRIHYATARYVALSEARNIPTDEALMMAAPGETPRRSTITAPTPTSALVPPPKVLEQSEIRVTDPSHPGEAARNIPMIPFDGGLAPPVVVVSTLPSSTCTDGCGGDYRGCSGGCEGDAGADAPKKARCTACSQKFKTCMRGCFK